MTDFKIPDGIDPVVGWRYWWLDDDGVLQSLHHSMPWPPRQRVVATCRSNQLSLVKRPHAHPPNEHCRCGIYASASLDDLRTATWALRERLIVGELYLWGDIVPGETGYRGQFAYPKALYVVPEGQVIGADTEVCEALSERYGVPVATMPASECQPAVSRIVGGQITATTIISAAVLVPVIQVASQAAQEFDAAMRAMSVPLNDAATALKAFTEQIDDETEETPVQTRLRQRKNWTNLNTRPKLGRS